MSSVNFQQLSFNEISEITTLLETNQLENLLQSLTRSSFDLIKVTLSILTTLADFDEESPSEASLSLFKKVCSNIMDFSIIPIISSLSTRRKDSKLSKTLTDLSENTLILPQLLSKWWVNYISILEEAFLKKKEIWGESLNEWFTSKDNQLLEESLESLSEELHWKIVLLKAICMKKTLIGKIKEFDENVEIIRKYQLSRLEKELNALEMIKSQKDLGKKNDMNRKFREKTLKTMKEIFLNEAPEAKEMLLTCRLDKKTIPSLSHTVILGEDGGFYVLFNKVTEEEKQMFLETEEISSEYTENWKIHPYYNASKVIIGKGTFGTIRLSIALIRNETSNTMKAGQIICVKKTTYLGKMSENGAFEWKDIRNNCWNDYSVGDVGD